MAKFARASFMLFFHGARVGLRFVDALAPRAYMRLFLPLLRIAGVKFTGTPRYISPGAKFDDFSLVSLGERVVISDRVVLLTHDYSPTTAIISVGQIPASDVSVRRGITVGENVFIGMGVMLLPGVTIGANVIVGAGSVVRGVIPSNSIVLGNPAQVVSDLVSSGRRWEVRLDSPTMSWD